jgi:hypothetical protein
MPKTSGSKRQRQKHGNAGRSVSDDERKDLAEDFDTAAEDSDNLQELSFDDDSRSDRHRPIGPAQSAQSDNAPDEDIDEEDDGNDIGEQEEE